MPDEVVIQTEYGSDKIVAPSNSKTKQERVKPEAVAKGMVKKESLAKKVFSEFITCDLSTVAETALRDILMPYIKDAMLDILHDSVDMVFNGGVSRRTRRNISSGGSYVSYGSYYSGSSKGSESQRVADRRAGYDFKEITFRTRAEAEDIIERMYDILDTDGSVTVADFYSLSGIRSVYTDETYGWKNLRAVTVRKVRDDYIIVLPKPLPL